jgi:hypothetical protein
MILMNNSYETRFSNTFDKLLISCNPHEDQVLSTWVVLAQKHASLIYCIVEVSCMMCECYMRM